MFYQSLSPLYHQHFLPWNDSTAPYPQPMWYSALYLAEFGNESTAILGQASNDPEDDGIWSSMQLIAQAMRYAVTNDSDAWSEAWGFFLGLEFLHNVTGIPGLVARSVQSAPAPPSATWRFNPWYNSTVFPDLVWEGGTSSDQLTGHLLAYAVMVRTTSGS